MCVCVCVCVCVCARTIFQGHVKPLKFFKPWPNGLASRRKFATYVRLAFRLATHLHRLATTCMDLCWLWSSSNLDASRRKFFTVWPPCASRHKLIASNLCEIYGFLRLANPFGHPSQVRTQVLVLQTCVDLRRLASPFRQGFREYPQFITNQTHTIRELKVSLQLCISCSFCCKIVMLLDKYTNKDKQVVWPVKGSLYFDHF